jgi:multidrug efflux system membrane fusion protein
MTRSALAMTLGLFLPVAVAGGTGCERNREAKGGASASAPGAGAAATAGRLAGRRALKFPVETQPVAARSVEYAVNAVGSVEAFETVQVTARVPGVVEKVRFAEGQRVAPGAVLVEVEVQRYRLEVEAARAAHEKTSAAQSEAAAGLERREKAVRGAPGLIPGEEIETWRTKQRTAAADTAEKKAALAQAELNLRDAYVRAPVAGLIETRKVQTGQYVQPGTVLATLIRREPLLLRFSVPAPEAASLRAGMIARFNLREGRNAHQARITHVAQAADANSRMVAVTAEVSGNAKEDLRPGAFAEVVVPIASPREAPVLPATAVRPTERGFVAFVVENGIAKEKILTLGLRTSDGAVEVKSGIQPGEMVVVRGAEALREGAAVQVEKETETEKKRPAPGNPDPKKLAP